MRYLRFVAAALFLFTLTVAPALADSEVDAVAQNIMCQCGCTMVLNTCECGTAEQLRGEIKAMLAEGKTQQQVLDYYVGKYGEKVLSAPTKQGFNLTAYITPFAGIVVAGGSIVFVLRRWVFKSQQAAKALLPGADATVPSNQLGSLDELRAQLARDLEDYGE